MIDPIGAVRRSIDGWNRDDLDRGVAGLRDYWDEWHELWRVRLKVMEIVRAHDTVVVVACTEARGDSSGVTLRQPIGYVYEFEDGLARRARSFIDPEHA